MSSPCQYSVRRAPWSSCIDLVIPRSRQASAVLSRRRLVVNEEVEFRDSLSYTRVNRTFMGRTQPSHLALAQARSRVHSPGQWLQTCSHLPSHVRLRMTIAFSYVGFFAMCFLCRLPRPIAATITYDHIYSRPIRGDVTRWVRLSAKSRERQLVKDFFHRCPSCESLDSIDPIMQVSTTHTCSSKKFPMPVLVDSLLGYSNIRKMFESSPGVCYSAIIQPKWQQIYIGHERVLGYTLIQGSMIAVNHMKTNVLAMS